MASIRFVCSKNDGKITYEVSGIKGENCIAATKVFDVLGDVKTQKTGEFYEHGQDNDVLINSHTS